jgi:hypothetical protein
MMVFRSITVLLLVWVAADATAHTPGACDEVLAGEQRLACYDEFFPPKDPPKDLPKDPPSVPATAKPAEPEPVEAELSQPVVVAVEQPAVEPPLSAEDQFGREQLEKKKGKRGQGLTSINSRITSIKKRVRQEMVFYLENGQVWLQVTARFRAIKEGAEVTINKARLGGYILTAENGVSTRVKRLR